MQILAPKKNKINCHMSHITCHMSFITCHLSPMPVATATDPSPANSTTMHWKRTNKKSKTQFVLPLRENISSWLCNFGNTLFDQKSSALLVPVANGGDRWTTDPHSDIATYRLTQLFRDQIRPLWIKFQNHLKFYG